MFTVEKDKSYIATIRLSGMEAWATNDMLIQKFAELGFTNVNVTGEGDRREAVGTWTDQTTTVSLPSQVSHAEEVKLVFDDGPEKKSDADHQTGTAQEGREVEDTPKEVPEVHVEAPQEVPEERQEPEEDVPCDDDGYYDENKDKAMEGS